MDMGVNWDTRPAGSENAAPVLVTAQEVEREPVQ